MPCFKKTLLILFVMSSCCQMINAGVAGTVLAAAGAYGECQSACNAGYVLCCTTAGFVAGTFTLGLGIPGALGACSASQGVCMATCAGSFFVGLTMLFASCISV